MPMTHLQATCKWVMATTEGAARAVKIVWMAELRQGRISIQKVEWYSTTISFLLYLDLL